MSVKVYEIKPGFAPDPEYDLIEPTPRKKGSQCGRCGQKFDYGVAYGYCCSNMSCPMGWGPVRF